MFSDLKEFLQNLLEGFDGVKGIRLEKMFLDKRIANEEIKLIQNQDGEVYFANAKNVPYLKGNDIILRASNNRTKYPFLNSMIESFCYITNPFACLEYRKARKIVRSFWRDLETKKNS